MMPSTAERGVTAMFTLSWRLLRVSEAPSLPVVRSRGPWPPVWPSCFRNVTSVLLRRSRPRWNLLGAWRIAYAELRVLCLAPLCQGTGYRMCGADPPRSALVQAQYQPIEHVVRTHPGISSVAADQSIVTLAAATRTD